MTSPTEVTTSPLSALSITCHRHPQVKVIVDATASLVSCKASFTNVCTLYS